MELCRLDHITKRYEQGESVTPLQDISLVIEPGDFVAIEGPSGAGKSTLLYVIGTLLDFDAGELYIGGKDISKLSDVEKTTLRSETIGFMFQDASFFQALTVYENLRFTQTLGGTRSVDNEGIEAALAAVGLEDRKNFFPHQLSGGQKRRLMAAVALIGDPSLILVDEPTNDLNEEWAEKILELFAQKVSEGAAVVMVTHHGKYAQRASRTYRLENGALVGNEARG